MTVDEIPVRVRRGAVTRSLLAFVVVHGLGVGALAWLAVDTALSRAPLASWQGGGLAALAIGAWLLVGAALLFSILEAYRFRFGARQLSVFGWRGWRAIPWAEVRSARLVAVRFEVRLQLGLGRRRVVSIPLLAYYGAARLLADLEHRLPVAVATRPKLQSRLEKASAPP